MEEEDPELDVLLYGEFSESANVTPESTDSHSIPGGDKVGTLAKFNI